MRCFGLLSVQGRLEVLQRFVDALTDINERLFRERGFIPLYQSGVYYCVDSKGSESQWYDACAVLEAGCADCKALAAYRAAELRANGTTARAIVITQNGQTFHVIVSANGQTEDPSRILGMKGHSR